jgi:phosphoribosyl 1,2-cyclic phosphodiesterase
MLVEREGVAGSVVVLDAGTGIRALGGQLARRDGGVRVDLLLTHTHWDHIQGLPFFVPMFRPGDSVRVWGAKQGDVELETILRQQMHPVVFPVPLDETDADLSVSHIGPGRFDVPGFAVEAIRLRHPGMTLGYRLTTADGSVRIAYITDNELGPGGSYHVSRAWRDELALLLAGVDLLVHDAMYTPEDIGQHLGWGHSSWEEAVDLAVDAEARRLMLFHHRPERTDGEIEAIVGRAQARADGGAHAVEVVAAREGMQLSL